ncbi:MAG: hypothetical protein HY303_18950 [Candidatus Wallbacteria bacterium]|nr:hypothetical protein [Candidatus Wallbacteria bacterium]
MAYFHISGRPRPPRVFAVLEPGEAPLRAPGAPGATRTTVLLAVPRQPPKRLRRLWPAVAGGCLLAVAAAIYLKVSGGPIESELPVAARPAKPARPSIFAPSKPVVTGENWTYGRTGKPPHQTVPSAAALTAYRNEMEKVAERQRKQLSALQ